MQVNIILPLRHTALVTELSRGAVPHLVWYFIFDSKQTYNTDLK